MVSFIRNPFGKYLSLLSSEAPELDSDSEGQGSLVCCSSWGRRESDTTEQLEGQEGQLSEKENNVLQDGALPCTAPSYRSPVLLPLVDTKGLEEASNWPFNGHLLSTCSGPGPWLDAKETKHDRHTSDMQVRRVNKNEPAHT